MKLTNSPGTMHKAWNAAGANDETATTMAATSTAASTSTAGNAMSSLNPCGCDGKFKGMHCFIAGAALGALVCWFVTKKAA